MMPTTVNFILRDIVKAYNEEENERAKRERRKPEELPHISAHILRHTACTRMAETDLDMKVVQYVMGHANISVTMEVYNHITDWFRIEKRLRRGIWFRLCDGSDFFKNDYRTTRYGPHDLHSFGRGYRLISEKK